MNSTEPTGFIGLGTMGEPMAMNLCRAGVRLVVWNRAADKCDRLAAAGAQIAPDPQAVFAQCERVILMLANGDAVDAVLGRHTPPLFMRTVRDRIVVNMSTVEPGYASMLDADVRAAGGRYVEAPVSGSRKPAELGELVAMLAGAPDDLAAIRPMLAPMCKTSVMCGPVPGALTMKLAVNVFLITMVTGLAEAAHFALSHRLDLAQFAEVLNAGPMASAVSRMKLDKLCTGDLSRQAGISDVLKNTRYAVEAAEAAGVASPLMNACLALYARAESIGYAGDDMISVVHAFARPDLASR
ncbi:NAD(P)-dependent oxidoreductase [Pararobbsia silviterrae]|uniref:NAD(P)-dependent oxidoreductase n=1 Tax=Pararobbsia silviterrae TaxID=1792498 RepID=A0A494Y4R6_9BURK|nr:NAD(P)-dependent oxidoreductase [Pararobbsia silviterrae]RKP57706.1 NAD(P)-dependent oxidoreductase [Pararobbsia silviterrae]